MSISYYEKVVVTSSSQSPQYIGRTGVVLGISKDDSRICAYSVSFEGEGEGVMFRPEELEGTGQFVDRSEFYDDNDRIRVRVVGDEGFLVE
jgi:Immunity protein 31